MNKAQQNGAPGELIKGKLRLTLDWLVQEFIGASSFAILGTNNADGYCDASMKGG